MSMFNRLGTGKEVTVGFNAAGNGQASTRERRGRGLEGFFQGNKCTFPRLQQQNEFSSPAILSRGSPWDWRSRITSYI